MDRDDHAAHRRTGLFGFLSGAAPDKVFISLLLGIAAGAAYTLVIPLVMQSLEPSSVAGLGPATGDSIEWMGFEISKPRYAVAFLILCVFILAARTASAVLLQWVAIDATRELRTRIYRRISRLPIMELERIGSSRLYSAIANDVPAIMTGVQAIPSILSAVATIAGLLGFLVYLNIHVFLFIIGTMLVGILTYRIPMGLANRFYAKARRTLDDIQEGIRGLIYGAKELKLNRMKRQAFREEALLAREEAFRSDSRRGSLLILLAANYGNMLSLLALGVAVFVISNRYGIETETLISIAMAMLYITGPLITALNSISMIVRGSVSLKALNALFDEMPVEPAGESRRMPQIKEIELLGVSLSYPQRDGAPGEFTLGPIDLTLRSGEINFLVGGNGSGKSTLGKILSLLYVPREGGLRFDGEEITAANRDRYRESIGAIYADFHLFTRLYGVSPEIAEALTSRYLRELGLESKVQVRDGRFSTIALSEGQKKRLALLILYLEDRDVYVFDEWAADQDPQFKELFYLRFLPELKSRGKLIVVITHDDRYFPLADRIVRMENGRILQDQPSGARFQSENIQHVDSPGKPGFRTA
jgi:putative pyoverdin transport system ATP-binding/permease protein